MKYNFKYKLDDPLRSVEHRNIIINKKPLKHLYTKWYNVFKEYAKEDGSYIELGSGGGFIKDIIPKIISSDINQIPGVDMFFSATDMPFEDNSIKGIFMIDSFHHFPDVNLFFKEAERVLEPNGVIVMIEPWNTRWSKFIYQKFHHELFDPERDWFFPLKGPLSGSNMALPYIVFKRDKRVFEEKYPNLNIKQIDLHTPLSYALSGGLSKTAFLPHFIFPFIRFTEEIKWIKNYFAMFATIVIQKNSNI